MLRIPATTIQTLTTALLQDDRLERVAFLECAESGSDLVVSNCEIVPDRKMETIDSTACKPADAEDISFIDQCIDRGRHPLIVHSHPFARNATFSTRDETKMRGEAGWIHALHDCQLLFGVLSQDELLIEEVHSDSSRTPIPTDIVGDWTLPDEHTVEPVPTGTDADGDTECGVDTTVYDRQIRAIGEDGQRKLADTHVAVVGCGGIGSNLVKELASQGIQRLTFIDPDRVETSNLPRLLQATENDVGRYKVVVMQEWYVTQVPESETTIISLPVEETAEYLTALDIDIIVAGLDQITPRIWLNEYAARHLIPYIDAGSIVEVDEAGHVQSMDAQTQVVIPGTGSGCFECDGRINTETIRRENLPRSALETEVDRGYIPGTALSPEPAVTPLNSVAAAEAVDALVRIVTGYRDPMDMVRYSSVEKQLAAGPTHESEDCYTCSRFVGIGDTSPVPEADTGTTEFELDAAVDQLANIPSATAETSMYRIPESVTAFFANHTTD